MTRRYVIHCLFKTCMIINILKENTIYRYLWFVCFFLFHIMHNRHNILSFFNKDCVLTINLNNTRFSVGDAFALPITVKDYNRKFMVSVAVYHPYSYPIGRTTILVRSVIFQNHWWQWNIILKTNDLFHYHES